MSVTVVFTDEQARQALADAHALDTEEGQGDGSQLPPWHDPIAALIGCPECEKPKP